MIGDFFVAVSDVDVPPTGWNKADGDFIPGAFPSTFLNLAGTYLRGGNSLDLVKRGSLDHTHSWPDAVSSFPDAGGAHDLGGASFTGPKQDGAVSQMRDDHDHQTAVPFVLPHDPNDHLHTHLVQDVTEPIGNPHIPLSHVINWIVRELTVAELKEYDGGTIFGFTGSLADIPAEWAHCNGQNGTPDLRDRLIRCGDSVASDGSDLHASTNPYFTDPAGEHNHGGVTSAESATTTGLLGVITTDLALSPHTHSVSGIGVHRHDVAPSAIGNLVDLKPPYRTMIFIKKIVDQSLPADNIALGVHIFYDPDETSGPSGGWQSVSASGEKFDSRYLVGRTAVGGPFQDLGIVGVGTHSHTVNFRTTTDGAHAHTIISVLELTGGRAGATSIPTNTHTHTVPTDSGHSHLGTLVIGDDSTNTPATVELQLFKKT